MPEVIYPELSYKLIGTAFAVFNSHGFGMSEKFYQKVFAETLTSEGMPFIREKLVQKSYGDEKTVKWYLDFVVDDKIVLELKVKPKLGYVHIKQVLEYLKVTGYKLAILIYFTREGVKYRRILNAKRD